jgi:RNA polymerase sigma factor (sigma-70 family)
VEAEERSRVGLGSKEEVEQLRAEIAKEVARRVRRSKYLSEHVTAQDREDAVAEGVLAIYRPVTGLDPGNVRNVGSWWDHYGRNVVHHQRLVVKFGADRAVQLLGRDVKKRIGEERRLRLVLPLVGPDVDGDPVVRSVIRRQTRRVVRALVEALDKPERSVIEARYWREETWPAIAESLGVTPSKARRIHASALRQLAKWLIPLWNTPSKE